MPHIDLLELPYFQGISIESLVSLIDILEPVQFEAGVEVITQGPLTPPPLYIVTRGSVGIRKTTPDGGQRTLAELTAPTLFGEIELFCQLCPVASVQTLSPVEAFVLNRSTYNKLFRSQNQAVMQFTFNVARVACHRLAMAHEMLAQHVGDHDLAQLRHSVSAKMSEEQNLMTTTGAFRVPDVLT